MDQQNNRWAMQYQTPKSIEHIISFRPNLSFYLWGNEACKIRALNLILILKDQSHREADAHYLLVLFLFSPTYIGLQNCWKFETGKILPREHVHTLMFKPLLLGLFFWNSDQSFKIKARESVAQIISPLCFFWRLAVIDWPLSQSDAHATVRQDFFGCFFFLFISSSF